jgi:hypothetical protein
MNNKPIFTHPLKNGLILVCRDLSKKIAADRWYIAIQIEIAIPVEKKWLNGLSLDEGTKNRICDTLGKEVVYLQKKERNFISDDVKKNVLREICENIRSIGETYFSHEKFPGKYMLKRFTDKKGSYEISRSHSI